MTFVLYTLSGFRKLLKIRLKRNHLSFKVLLLMQNELRKTTHKSTKFSNIKILMLKSESMAHECIKKKFIQTHIRFTDEMGDIAFVKGGFWPFWRLNVIWLKLQKKSSITAKCIDVSWCHPLWSQYNNNACLDCHKWHTSILEEKGKLSPLSASK